MSTTAALGVIGLVAVGLLTAPGASARELRTDPAAGSSAAAGCTVKSVSPSSLVLGLSAISPTWKVTTTGCTSPSWTIDLHRGLGRPTSKNPKITIDPTKLKNSAAGTKDATVTVTEDLPIPTSTPTPSSTTNPPTATPQPTATEPPLVEGRSAAEVTKAVKITLKRRAAWSSVKAAPQPIDGGKQLKISGTLKIADWAKNSYVTYRGRPVRVQFKAVGKSTWKSVKTVKTSAKGRISTAVRATADGSWRLQFTGSSISGSAASAADYVEVITAKDRRVFRNCDQMNAVYPHGVGRIGAVDQVGGSTDPVTNFVRNNHLYSVNDGRDRDDDKIACEKL